MSDSADLFGLKTLSKSQSMISIWDPKMAVDTEGALEAIMQIGLCVAQSKPLIVVHRPKDVVPKKLALAADAIIEMDKDGKWQEKLMEVLLSIGVTSDVLERFRKTGEFPRV